MSAQAQHRGQSMPCRTLTLCYSGRVVLCHIVVGSVHHISANCPPIICIVPAPVPEVPECHRSRQNPYEQLEVARKITVVAVATQASCLDLENARLQQRPADKDRLHASLINRAATLKLALRNADAPHSTTT
jgi:hypothetical protein